MLDFTGWVTGDFAFVAAGLLFALIIGKLLRNEARLYAMVLIAVVLTDSVTSLFVVPLIAMVGKGVDMVVALWG